MTERRHITDPAELARIMRDIRNADYIIESGGPGSLVVAESPEQSETLTRYVEDMAADMWATKETPDAAR